MLCTDRGVEDMGQFRAAWDIARRENLSLKRIAGVALQWLWMIMMFYSIVPYSFSSDVRGTLYMSLLISLVSMVVTLLFVAIIVRRESVGASSPVVIGSATMMSLGSVLTPFADPTTPTGMLSLGVGAIMTGTGSAVLFLCWVELLSGLGGRLALVELAFSLCVSFVAAYGLTFAPQVPAILVIMFLPAASAFLLKRSMNGEDRLVSVSEQTLSHHTLALFVKALAGAALIGMLEGFFDVVSGFKTYAVQNVFGSYLLLAGFVGALAVLLIAVFLRRDGVFFAYRFAMLMLCLGCLSTPFMADNNTYSYALIFGGYHCYVLVLCVVCIDVATSFRVGPARAIGLGFFALYGGEAVGSTFAHSLLATGIPLFDLTVVTLVAVSLLFIAHLFLFTETDLIKIGIGEVNLVGNARNHDVRREGGPVDPCIAIVALYALSPRESEVLPLLLEGRTISRIQETLFISAGTVSTHIRHIYQKTGVNNRQELIDLAKDDIPANEEM